MRRIAKSRYQAAIKRLSSQDSPVVAAVDTLRWGNLSPESGYYLETWSYSTRNSEIPFCNDLINELGYNRLKYAEVVGCYKDLNKRKYPRLYNFFSKLRNYLKS